MVASKNFMYLFSHKHDFGISAEWVFFATRYSKSPCNSIGGAIKMTCSQLQRLRSSLSNQILDYKAILDLCKNEMLSIKFFGICKESIISVENLQIKKWHGGRE